MLRKSLREKSAIKKIFRQSFISYSLYYAAYALAFLVDGIVIGNYLGIDVFAAYTLSYPAVAFFMFIYAVMTSGSRSIFTKLLGQGKIDEANNVFTLANILCLIFSLIAAAILFIFANQIMRLLGATGQNAKLELWGADYLKGYSLGLVFCYCAKFLHGYMNIDSDYVRTIYAIAIMTLVNIAGDVYVALCTDFGIFGMGLATSFSYVVYFAVLALHFRKSPRILHLRFRLKDSLSYFLKICSLGSSAAILRFVRSSAAFLTYSIISVYAASSAIAAYGVQGQFLKLFDVIYMGVAETILVMAGVYYGEEDKNALDELQVYSMKAGISLAVISGLLVFVFADFLADVYMKSASPEAVSMGIEALRSLAFAMPFYVINYCFLNYMHGVARIQAANVYIIFLQVLVPLPCVYVLLRIFGARGAWFAVPAAAVLTTIVCCIYIYIQKVPDNIKKRLMLGKKFFMDEGAELSLVADSVMEVMGMSSISMQFCEENNFSRKIASRLALCIEEMGRNIIQHGFIDGRQHYIYLRMLARDDKIILRIRDDCKAFNPLEYYEMTSQNQEDPAKNIGIRLIIRMCSDIVYMSTFNTNNLIITLPREPENDSGKNSLVKYLANHEGE